MLAVGVSLFDLGITDEITSWANAPFWGFVGVLVWFVLHLIGQRFNCFSWGWC